MATFSLGTSGNTPGAPGVYINEQPGRAANANLADFSTVYMLVETEDDVPVTRFPFNTPIAITSLNDYKELIRIGTSTVPDERIPLLSYNCVNEFFQNAQVGDLRVVRVGTPNQIVEIEFFPSGSKINTTDLPSALQAGNKVYVQMIINGLKLVAGDGSTGYTADGEWLGVPVEIPVNYVAGDEVNNRKISAAIATAVADAIESNPAVRSSVYVRSVGLVNDLDPTGNSQNGYVTIAATTFDGNVTVITEVQPVGSNFVFMQNTYDVENIVGGSVALDRVPQDYTQCIQTAFDGQQDQGYLITPTAYAQFDAKGRSLVGAAAAAHCESNNYKWMALADPGPFLITDVNKYSEFVPHQAAADLIQGNEYLVDNAIFEWIGTDVTYDKLTNQTIVYGESAETAVRESANLVAANTRVGLLDTGAYTINAVPSAVDGIFTLNTAQWWPVTLPIQKVTLTTSTVGNDFTAVSVQGQPGIYNLATAGEVYLIAPPYNTTTDSEYSLNYVFLAVTAADAANVYNAVVLAGGTANITAPPIGAAFMAAPTGDTALVAYPDPYWDIPVSINGQTSDLIENISGAAAGVNTLHLPGTLQDPTNTYRLGWISRTIFDVSSSIATYAGAVTAFSGAANFNCVGHGLRSGQKIYFTQPVVVSNGTLNRNLVNWTTKLSSSTYWVKVVDADNFVLASSLNNYSVGAYVGIPTGYSISNSYPTIFYSQVLGGGITAVSPTELITIPLIRGRKYEFDSSSIFDEAASASVAPVPSAVNPAASIFINNSALILGEDLVNPFGEDLSSTTLCDWLPELNLVAPTTTPIPLTTNAYCSPVTDDFFQTEAFFVPSIDPIFGGLYDPTAISTLGPIATLATSIPSVLTAGANGTAGTYTVTTSTTGVGTGATLQVTIGSTTLAGRVGVVTSATAPLAGAATVPQLFTSSVNSYSNVGVTGGSGAGATFDVLVSPVAATGDVAALTAYSGFGTAATAVVGAIITGISSGAATATVDFTTTATGAIDPTTVVITAPGAGYTFGETVTITSGADTWNAVIDASNADGTVTSAILNQGGLNYTVADVLTLDPATIFVGGSTVNVSAVRCVTNIVPVNLGINYAAGDTLTFTAGGATAASVLISAITAGAGQFTGLSSYALSTGLQNGSSSGTATSIRSRLVGVYFDVTAAGFTPDGASAVIAGDRMAMTFDGSSYAWVVVPAVALGGDLTSVGQVCYQSQVQLTLTPEQAVPSNLWRFDAITSTEIFSDALRGVGFNGVPQAEFIEAGIDNVNRLFDDSQRYGNPFGFIAYYGPYIENGAGQFIPPSPYVTGVAVRRYRSEGYQFPPAGVKYQLADAVGAQIAVNSSQQNLLNPKGCNVVRTLPGYPQNAVFIWGGRTRLLNPDDAQQKLYQFVNTRVILNVVYGSLRTAFDNQIFNVIDGFGVIFNQIISVGNSVLNQLYVKGALFGSRPSDAFQVICDRRINPPEDIENGIVNAKVFVTPVPTLERIQIDLIRVAIGKMQQELDIQGLGQSNQ
jgi:hypothetical protein